MFLEVVISHAHLYFLLLINCINHVGMFYVVSALVVSSCIHSIFCFKVVNETIMHNNVDVSSFQEKSYAYITFFSNMRLCCAAMDGTEQPS